LFEVYNEIFIACLFIVNHVKIIKILSDVLPVIECESLLSKQKRSTSCTILKCHGRRKAMFSLEYAAALPILAAAALVASPKLCFYCDVCCGAFNRQLGQSAGQTGSTLCSQWQMLCYKGLNEKPHQNDHFDKMENLSAER
jgi:hypothetical protein